MQLGNVTGSSFWNTVVRTLTSWTGGWTEVHNINQSVGASSTYDLFSSGTGYIEVTMVTVSNLMQIGLYDGSTFGGISQTASGSCQMLSGNYQVRPACKNTDSSAHSLSYEGHKFT